MHLLTVENLCVDFPLRKGTIHAVDHVNLNIAQGKLTAIVGESGSGKTTLAKTFLQYVSAPGVITQGHIWFDGADLLACPAHKLHKYRWKEISLVFQASQSALNPVMTIQQHFWETFEQHMPGKKQADALPLFRQLLADVRLDPERVLGAYPHELSGGMKQRVMIAFAMLLSPRLIILDEPTTALDVITQAYIFDILAGLHEKSETTMVLLTHDIAVVARVADYIGVMYAGSLVEFGEIHQVFAHPAHPYTAHLIHAAPSLLDDFSEKESAFGAAPDLFHLPEGCPYAERCPRKTARCLSSRPGMRPIADDLRVACRLYDEEGPADA